MQLWQDNASCINLPYGMFFPEDDNYEKAQQICSECDVRVQCLMFALSIERKVTWSFGMFGGKTPHERRAIIEGPRRVM